MMDDRSVKKRSSRYYYIISIQILLKIYQINTLFSVGVSGASRTGDMCAFNTDCQSGMYCFNGACTCLSDYVAIAGYCWQSKSNL